MALADIDHIVFVMMENRSFDHMLGYLSLDETDGRIELEGLRSDKAWQDSWINVGDGKPYPLVRLTGKEKIADPPHGSVRIGEQINRPTANNARPTMGGFVQAYLESRRTNPRTGKPINKKPLKHPGHVMGYYDGKAVPTFDFFAKNYCVCDHWFTPLPLGTQANRLMAMAGESGLSDNDTWGFPDHNLVYDWIDRTLGKDQWRTYTYGGFVPFFTLMKRMRGRIAQGLCGKGPFKRFSLFEQHWKKDKAMPPVIFLEPEYSDGPGRQPNDDHPPTGVEGGQRLLNRIYQILTSNPQRWAKTLLIVTYDEHGGFFDHVPPPRIPGKGGNKVFETAGPRVPALLVSPHVGPGSVFSEPVDHTSFLQLLDDRFNGGKGYSEAVTKRTSALGGRLANALKPPRPGPAPKLEPVTEVKGITVGRAFQAFANREGHWAPDTPNAVAYHRSVRALVREHPEVLEADGTDDLAAFAASPEPKSKNLDHIQ